MIIGVGAGSEERDGLLVRVQSGRVACWFEVESAVVCWMGLVGVVIGISIVEAKRWKGGLGFGACYYFKSELVFITEKLKKWMETKSKEKKQIFLSFFPRKPITKFKTHNTRNQRQHNRSIYLDQILILHVQAVLLTSLLYL